MFGRNFSKSALFFTTSFGRAKEVVSLLFFKKIVAL